jgi:hypothetical protein
MVSEGHGQRGCGLGRQYRFRLDITPTRLKTTNGCFDNEVTEGRLERQYRVSGIW